MTSQAYLCELFSLAGWVAVVDRRQFRNRASHRRGPFAGRGKRRAVRSKARWGRETRQRRFRISEAS
jgi:hypothetical protein